MATWARLIARCLRASGVVGMGQTANAQMQQDVMDLLNDMLDEWRAQEYMAFQVVDRSAVCNGTANVTIGPGAEINVSVRPDALEYAFLRQIVPSLPTPVDYSLQVLLSPKDYAAIPLKQMQAAPGDAVWLDEAFPVANIKIFPVPMSNQWELHVGILGLLERCDALEDEINLPPRYDRAIYANLCVAVGTAYRIDPKPMMLRQASASLRAIRRKNTRVPLLNMPAGLTDGTKYNIYSDRGG